MNKKNLNMSIKTGRFSGAPQEAPEFYWKLSKDEVERRTNGTGPNNWFFNLFPERVRSDILGMDCENSSNIHDLMYEYENKDWSDEDYLQWKKICDVMHRENLMKIIDWYDENGRTWLTIYPAKGIAWTYYGLLRTMGKRAFLNAKKEKTTF